MQRLRDRLQAEPLDLRRDESPGRRPCDRLRVPSSLNIVIAATKSKVGSCAVVGRARVLAAAPGNRGRRARHQNLVRMPARTVRPSAGIAERLHVFAVGQVVDRDEARLCARAMRTSPLAFHVA